jgi:hypothetical protein
MSTKGTTSAPAPAAFVFEDVAIPVVTRVGTARVNPFTPKVAALVADWNDKDNRSNGAVALTVPRVNFPALSRQISQAGHAANVSMRIVKEAIEGHDNAYRMTFWAVGKITRKPKVDAATSTPSATA